MRDLMMMMLCSIVGYHVIKRLKWWVFLLLLLVNIFHIGVPVVGFSLAAITFFHAGAFFSIHHIHVFDWLVQRKYLWLILWPVLVVLLGLLTCIDVEFNWMHSVVLFCGVAFVLVIAYYFAGKKNRILEIVSRWGETSFFIYTFGNTLILWFINKDFGYFLETIPFCGYFLNYEFLFLARVAECVFVYYLMKRYTPSLLSFVIGGRIIYKKNTRCS